MEEKFNKIRQISDDNVVEISVANSLIEQLLDNHSEMVNLAADIQDGKKENYWLGYETIRLSSRTENMFNLVTRILNDVSKMNEEIMKLVLDCDQELDE